MGTKNTLADLNNHLFEQLERLNDDDLTGEKLQEERERAKSMASIAQTIINNGELALKAVKHYDEYGKDRKRKQYQDKGTGSVMPAGDSMPDTYIAIMLQSLKKKEQVLDEIIRLDDRQKDTLTDPECPFDVFDETVEAKSACIDQLNQLDSGFEKLYAQVAEELDQNREDYAKEIRDMQQCIRRVTDKSVKIQAQEARNKELMREKFATIHRQAKAVRKNSRAITGYYNSMKEW